jgi:hypothetical protein
MSVKNINTKLQSGSKKLKPGKNVQLGPCIFPFKYKDQIYNECYKGSHGDWCATEVDSKGKMKKYAFCDYEPKAKSASPKAQAQAKTKSASPKSKAQAKTKSASPKAKSASKKLKLKIIPKFNYDLLDPEYKLPIEKTITPTVWELPNRKTFQNWVFDNYKQYISKKGAVKFNKGQKFDFFNHQKFVRDYLQVDSPYRGLLLFHGLGVGKTCASIGIAEGFRDSRKIVILLNKSLKKNFIVNLMKCGFEYFRINQHWVFNDLKSNTQLKLYSKFLKIPESVIKKNGGAFFVDFKKKPNYEELSGIQQEMLNLQINEMIKNKYSFLHLDGLNESRLKKLISEEYLNDKMLIIDEVHNLSNAMAKSSPGVRGKYLKELIMEAKNLKCVFLSGTPMINNLHEAGQLFNLLRGFMVTFTFILTPQGNAVPFEKLKSIIEKHSLVDQFFVDKRNKRIKLTKVPDGFENTKNGVKKSDLNINNESFIDIVTQLFNENGYTSKISIERQTAFPNNEEEFMNLFYDESRNKVKNPKLFQSRILGLVSYYKTQNKELLPTVTKNEVIEVPMSDYQFLKYSNIRKDEIDQEKQSKSKGKGEVKEKAKSDGDDGDLFGSKSSYRAYSRMHCSFVFPEEIPRPTPGDLLLKEAIKTMDKESKKEYYEQIRKSMAEKSRVDVEITQLKTKLDLLQTSNANNSQVTVVKDKIKELEEINERIIAFEAEPDPEYDVDDMQGEVKKEDKKLIKTYEQAKEQTLNKLDEERSNYLEVDEELKLLKYSPKYNLIVNKINEIKGLSFIYTEYRTLEGIATLEIVLKANGYAPFLIEKNGDDDYLQVFENEDDVDKPKYALWGGDEESSDIIRKVYNNDFEELPQSLKRQLEESGKNNLRGDVVKVLLTTKTGAEGIDLHNVRQVHIIEPFWNPVRTKQVKGRAVRVGSHIQLPPKDRTVEIFTYLATITKPQLKSDKQIASDKGGMSSDQVLYEISMRKLEVMEDFLKLIKEVAVDCNLNYEEINDEKETLTCFSYGSKPSREYSYIPNISEEHGDFERERRTKITSWKPIFIKIPIKGHEVEFAVKKASIGEKNYLYNAETFKLGVVGEPIGYFIEQPNGKKKFMFTKKAEGLRTKKNRKQHGRRSKRK